MSVNRNKAKRLIAKAYKAQQELEKANSKLSNMKYDFQDIAKSMRAEGDNEIAEKLERIGTNIGSGSLGFCVDEALRDHGIRSYTVREIQSLGKYKKVTYKLTTKKISEDLIKDLGISEKSLRILATLAKKNKGGNIQEYGGNYNSRGFTTQFKEDISNAVYAFYATFKGYDSDKWAEMNARIKRELGFVVTVASRYRSLTGTHREVNIDFCK